MNQNPSERIEELKSDWQRLANSDQATTPFQTYEWAHAWWSAYGSEYNLSIQSEETDQPDWISALVTQEKKKNLFTENTAHMLGVPNSATDYGSIFIGHPASYQEAIGKVFSENSDISFFQLGNLLEGSRDHSERSCTL